jgi:hypothetical protein
MGSRLVAVLYRCWRTVVSPMPSAEVSAQSTTSVAMTAKEAILAPKYKDVTFKRLRSLALGTHSDHPPQLDPNDWLSWTRKELLKRLDMAKSGDPNLPERFRDDRDNVRSSWAGAIGDVVIWAYKEYLKTGEDGYLDVARAAYWYGETKLGKRFFNSVERKAIADLSVMEAEVTELTGVARGERDPERRLTHRNGYRERRWDTRVGTIDLSIPRVRDGSYLPSLLEPRRRAERALLAVVQEAYVLGVSTRRVEDLVEALGISSLSRSQVSRICAALDAEVEAFRSRSLAGEAYPYLWLDATYVKVRESGRVVNMAALVAIGVSMTGERRVLGLDLAPGCGRSPREAHWRDDSPTGSTVAGW